VSNGHDGGEPFLGHWGEALANEPISVLGRVSHVVEAETGQAD
jgi:hypothetical protein